MKATELMIGDWVYNSYHKKNIKWSYSEMFCPNGIPVIGRDLEPIPLTPEILEKNGWLNGPYSRLSLQDGKWLEFYWHEHRLQEYWEGIDEWQSHIKQLELVFKTECIFYVHELQHALRLCGLNELADNFKV